jgi:hypothetical protein
MKTGSRRFSWMMTLALAAGGPALAERVAMDETPAEYLSACISNARRFMTGNYTGDGWTWHACWPMEHFLDAYEATRDPAWLDSAVAYFDHLIELRMAGPDGQPGWLGPAYRMPGRLGEHPIGDAIMIGPMVRFAAMVLADEPERAARFGDAARRYVALAETQMFGKWRERGIWREDGDYGAFLSWPWTYTEEESDRWREPPAGHEATTLPINMQVHWGVSAARLHRITGAAAWRDMARRIFNFAKSRLNLYDDHYSWNYWEPFGPWDVRPDTARGFASWIDTHPYRDYQAGEVAAFVVAYHHGITFDETDMRRFLRTNLHVMWNGDLDDMRWNNSNAGVQIAALGEIRRGTPQADGRFAGTLWTALVPFDATARRIRERLLTPGSIAHVHYREAVARREPGVERRHPDLPAEALDFPFSPCSTLTMVAVIPSAIERGEAGWVVAQGRRAGALAVELRSADGGSRVAALADASLDRPPFIHHLRWMPDGIEPGRYRVRWTLDGAYRDYPVEVR